MSVISRNGESQRVTRMRLGPGQTASPAILGGSQALRGRPGMPGHYSGRKESPVLFHFARRLVSGLGENRVLDRLALLVLDGQRVAARVHQFHLDLAERPVVRLVARRIGDHVLSAQRLAEIAKDTRVLALKLGEKRSSPGFLRERIEFVVRSEEVYRH